jgi:hypothetical protein
MARLELRFIRDERYNNIDLILLELLQHPPLAGADYGQPQMRPPGVRRGEHFNKMLTHGILAHAEADKLCGRIGACHLHDMIVDRQQTARRLDDILAKRRKADTRCTLVEQLNAKKKLQPPDLCADGRLRHALRFGGTGETA